MSEYEHGAFTNQEDVKTIMDRARNPITGKPVKDIEITKQQKEFYKAMNNENPIKILILGYGRHGKDTAAELFNDFLGLRFTSSSLFCAEKVVYPVLKKEFGYQTVEECYNDRHNEERGNRARWYELIKAYNQPDGSRLTREILEVADLYVGMRNIDELRACKEKNLFDLIVWVDASERCEPEGKDSRTITKEDADVIIENNGTPTEFHNKVKRFCKALKTKL